MSDIKKDKGNIAKLYRFLIISFFFTTILPSIAYIVYVFILGYNLDWRVAVFLMLLSFTTNMEIWVLSVYTAKSTYSSIDKLKEETERYKKIADLFLSMEDGEDRKERGYYEAVREDDIL